MAAREIDGLSAIVWAAIRDAGVDSAAVFVVRPGTSELELGAAAGIEGPPLDRLIEAVRLPTHPITRSLADPSASFDVVPIAPGGPALRSHLPLLVDGPGGHVAVGVLAVAHGPSLDAAQRQLLLDLASRAAAAIDASA